MKKQILSFLLVGATLVVAGQDNTKQTIQNSDGSMQSIYNQTVNGMPLNNNKSQAWLSSDKVSDYPNEDSRDMSVAIGPDSTVHVVYCDDVPGYPGASRQRITYKQKVVGGVWTSPIIIDAFNGVTPRNNHESHVNVSDNGDVHVVYHYWAYDGTSRNQITYSKYTKATSTWSTEIISGGMGTVFATYSDYPRVVSTDNNVPVVVWGNDERNGEDYDEAFLTYNNGTWQTPIELSSSDSSKAQFPRAISIGGEKVFIIFREYNNDQDTLALYYRVFDASNGSLTGIQKIQNSERESISNFDSYYLFDAAYDELNDEVYIGLNSKDTIISYTYDVVSNTHLKNNQEHYTNILNGYNNYHFLSVCADNVGKIHLAYNVWNTLQTQSSYYYMDYDKVNGYSAPQIFSTPKGNDAPEIIFGVDENLHIVFDDDSEDTNNDGYIDREVYYTKADITIGLFEQVSENNLSLAIYPNPSNGIVNIASQEKIQQVAVYNLTGALVKTINNSFNRINLSEQPKGIYFIHVQTKNDNVIKKLILE